MDKNLRKQSYFKYNEEFLLEFKDIQKNKLIKVNEDIDILLSRYASQGDKRCFDEMEFFKRKFDELINLLRSD